MQVSQKGIDLIKEFESCSLVVYLDIKGFPTVGWGHRTDLPVGTEISQEDADNLLSSDCTRFEIGVTRLVIAPITQNQFDALVCLSFNIGLAAFSTSHLLQDLNQVGIESAGLAADQFLCWCHANGQVVEGLLRRRQAEKALFTSP